MPIYEYECDKCSCHFDLRQRFFDEAVAECPKCQSKSHRVFCPAPVIFKGSGFYVTDTRKQQDIKDIGKPGKETAEKFPQLSGLDKSSGTDSKAKPDAK
jgi:putative FmdB family regulatory protein